MQAYREYWDNHVERVGPVTAVSKWDVDRYLAFYRLVFADIAERRVRVVADVGCGPALLVPLLQELYGRITYHGYDVSEKMIDYAASQWAGYFHLITDKLEILHTPDLIICHSVFTHITPDDALEYLTTFRGCIAQGGLISASIHTNCDETYSGGIERMDYNPAYFEDMIKEAGLSVVGWFDTAVPSGAVRYYRLGVA